MGKTLLLVAAVLIGALAFFVFGTNGEDGSSDEYDETLDDLTEDAETHGPMLEAAPAPIRQPRDAGTNGSGTRPTGPKLVDWLSGTVSVEVTALQSRVSLGTSVLTKAVRGYI